MSICRSKDWELADPVFYIKLIWCSSEYDQNPMLNPDRRIIPAFREMFIEREVPDENGTIDLQLQEGGEPHFRNFRELFHRTDDKQKFRVSYRDQEQLWEGLDSDVQEKIEQLFADKLALMLDSGKKQTEFSFGFGLNGSRVERRFMLHLHSSSDGHGPNEHFVFIKPLQLPKHAISPDSSDAS